MLDYSEIYNGKGFYFADVDNKNGNDGKHYCENRYGRSYISSYDLSIYKSRTSKEEIKLKKDVLKGLILDNKILVFDLKMTRDDKLVHRDYLKECSESIRMQRNEKIFLLNNAAKQSNNNIMKNYITFQKSEQEGHVINVVGIVKEERFPVADIRIFKASAYDRYFFKIDAEEGFTTTFVCGNPCGGHGSCGTRKISDMDVSVTRDSESMVDRIIKTITYLLENNGNE